METVKRLNKKYTLSTAKPIQLRYGTTNKDNPQVVYLALRCWLMPSARLDYAKAFDEIKKCMKAYVKDNFANGYDFDKKFIIDFDLNLDGMGPNCIKRKYFTMDVFLKQKEGCIRKMKALKPSLDYQIGMLGENLYEQLIDYQFTVYKKKKGE